MAGPRQIGEVLRRLLDGQTPAQRESARAMLIELANTISPGVLPDLFRALAHEIALAGAIEASDLVQREDELRQQD